MAEIIDGATAPTGADVFQPPGALAAKAHIKSFEQYRELLIDDTVIVLRGKIEDRSEEPGLILEQLMTIEEALKKFDGGLIVHVEPEDDALLPRLKQTLQKHKGRRPLYLSVKGSDGHTRRIRCGSDLRVSINAELTEEIDCLLGRGRTRLARM